MFKWPIDPQTIQRLNLSNSLGPELTRNGTFTGSASGWTLGAAWAYNLNAVDKNLDGITTAAQTLSIVTAKVYLITFVVSNLTVGTVTVSLGGTSGTAREANGTYREYIKTANATGALTFTPTNTARFTLDTVSVKEVGNAPADQVTMWVEDQGGTAAKATLYIRGENGTVVGIGGDGFTFGADDQDVTVTYSANALTLAGGQWLVPDGTSALPAIAFSSNPDTGFIHNDGVIGIVLNVNPGIVLDGQSIRIGSSGEFQWANISNAMTGTIDTQIAREAAQIIQQGADNAVPLPQTFKGPDGFGADKAGGDMTSAAGRPTGTGTPGVHYIATSTTGTVSNSTQQASVNRVKTTETGVEILADNLQSTKIARLTELTTILAAATTDTAIQIPANTIVLGVSVRVTTVIPTAATFTVTGTTTATAFQTGASVSTAAGTTDVGTKSCPYLNTAAQTVRITPNLVPAAATGQVRVTIHYILITAPSS